MTYSDYGKKAASRVRALLDLEGVSFPSSYKEYTELDQQLRFLIARHLHLVLSDNYEHFMAKLPHKEYGAQHILIRQQIGGFTVAAGYWKLLEFLSHQLTHEEVRLVEEYMSGRHNGFPRQFDGKYWHDVVDTFDGYLPIMVRIPTSGASPDSAGEGVTFTGVPFPIAEVYGQTPALWLNEPMYIQMGHLTHVATVAAQYAEATGDPWRFIEVAFRALHNAEESPDFLLAMLIGGGIISTSNDLGAFVNGAPFKPTGTTAHAWYAQYPTMKDALRVLLSSPLGPYSTALLDLVKHERGFQDMLELIELENLHPPFATRPDSGDVLALALHDMETLQDRGHSTNTVVEDGRKPKDVAQAEAARRHYGLEKKRMLHGAGGGFIGPRSDLEAAYKASLFHNGTPKSPVDVIETQKIALGNRMKESIAGRVDWFYNPDTGFYTIGEMGERPPEGCRLASGLLYDGLTTPGKPYFNPAYDPKNLALCPAIVQGTERSKLTRGLLGPMFTQDFTPNRTKIAMTYVLRKKRQTVEDRLVGTNNH